jgi:hypothetical protein
METAVERIIEETYKTFQNIRQLFEKDFFVMIGIQVLLSLSLFLSFFFLFVVLFVLLY